MISAITRNQQNMSFAYDKTYQLTSEIGRYASNCVPFVSFVVSNQFAYDDAGNRIQLCQILDGKARVDNYMHTADNQLTSTYWNAGKLTLRGIVSGLLDRPLGQGQAKHGRDLGARATDPAQRP